VELFAGSRRIRDCCELRCALPRTGMLQVVTVQLCAGSLVARIVFQPLEEICRVYFSRILYPSTAEAKLSSTTAKPTRRSLVQASEILLSLISIQLSCSVLIIGFATVYLEVFLHLLLPSQYLSTSAPRVLAAWVWYIPVLAINGVLEAFFSSIATPRDLQRQSRSALPLPQITFA
jgi:oligosaccharide translocation protein RFT1